MAASLRINEDEILEKILIESRRGLYDQYGHNSENCTSLPINSIGSHKGMFKAKTTYPMHKLSIISLELALYLALIEKYFVWGTMAAESQDLPWLP